MAIDIQRRVYNLITKYDTSNPYQLAKDLGIVVQIHDMPKNIRGCYTYLLRRRFIGINSALSEVAAKAVLCHELGHARLHGIGTFSCTLAQPRIKYSKEFEANLFALHLLSYSSDFDLSFAQKYLKEKRPESAIIHRLLSEIII